jgi:hypothetical protein
MKGRTANAQVGHGYNQSGDANATRDLRDNSGGWVISAITSGVNPALWQQLISSS